jgi:chromosome segregation protein
LRIKELRLSGFKSFVEPTRAPIEEGLTGIVGPNGCGKSNLLESVRWVMGVNSPKAMRGGEMDDVIFAGTNSRPSREHAEVTLVLENSDGKAPAPFSNDELLEVSRRIRRGLGSIYKINSREVRAKDVQLLFADASTGANSPALVRQGQISELINAKPENRRRILEEAAGIGGLQARRHEADLKLKAAEANLTRLDEVLGEIEALANSLKKQARQAERYRAVADELRRVEALLFHRRLDEARTHVAAADAQRRDATRAVAEAAEKASIAQGVAMEAQAKVAPAREEEMIAAAVLRKLEGVRVGLERDLKDADDVIARLGAEAARLTADQGREERFAADARDALARLNQERGGLAAAEDEPAALRAAEETFAAAEQKRAEADGRLEEAAAALAAGKAETQALARAAGEAKQRLVRAEERLAALKRDRIHAALPADHAARGVSLEDALAAAEKKAEAAEAARAKAETEAASAEKQERALFDPMRKAEARAGEIAAEVRALEKLTAQAAAQKFPPALNAIKAKPGYERAVAAALGDDVNAALDAKAPLRWAGAGATAKISWPDGAEPLSPFVDAPKELAARLMLCAIVERAQGPALAAQLKPGMRLVSREGDLWRWDGFVREAGAAPLGAAARLEQVNRLEKAQADRKIAEAAMLEAQRLYEAARNNRERTDATLKAARSAAPATQTAALEARGALERHEAEAERMRARLLALESQESALHTERSEAEGALKSANAAASVASDPQAAEAALNAARETAGQVRGQAAEARAALAALTREREARKARGKAVDAESAQWRTRLESAEARLKDIAASLEGNAAAAKAATDAPVQARAALEQLHAEAQDAEGRRAQATDNLVAIEARERDAARAARTAEALHAQEREAKAGAEARFDGAEARANDVITQIRDVIGTPPEDLPRRAGDLMRGPLAAGPLADVERKADRLRAEREAAGPVNLRAEEELAETNTRIETLAREKADVASAITKLRRAIGELNAEGRSRLSEAFNIVNGHFGVLFSTLFEGGAAELRFHPPEDGSEIDPLTAGLEIYAQPPGKKVSVLSLMSGGEQALTATALIFAVFLANPAPICVLDEVDAPLDDANVERFCNMLDEMRRRTDTRFLVITHNPVTMARMDRLYGVTMAERGVSQLVSVDLKRAAELAAA